MSLKKRGWLSRRLCRVDSSRNWVFEAFKKTRFVLPQSETNERSEIKRPIASRLESFNFSWVGCRLYNNEKCKVVSSA